MRALPVAIVIAAAPLARAGDGVLSFTERTTEAGLAHVHESDVPDYDLGEKELMTPGAAVADVDRDGDLDLLVQNGLGHNLLLFINDGAGNFTEEALARGIDLTGVEGSSVSVGDVDGDGDLDVYAGAFDAPNHLLINVGDGTFTDAGLACGAVLHDGDDFDAYGAAFGDVNGDGALDLVTADWSYFAPANALFLGAGDGTFVESTAAWALFDFPNGGLHGFTPALVDLDGDRRPECAVAGDFGTSRYYAHTGAQYVLVEDNGTGTDENGMGSAFGDYDGDGDLDWFVTSIWDDDGDAEGNWGITGNRLYRNDGGHAFTDVTDEAGVREGDWGWGASFGDLDLDGDLDLAMTNGFVFPGAGHLDPTFIDDPTRVWINQGDGATPRFLEAAAALGIDHDGSGKALLLFDSDGDGDLDCFITTNHGAHAYYRNDLDPAGDRWLAVDLVAPVGAAPDGIGATIDVVAGSLAQRRQVFGNPTFMGQEPFRAHFGFPSSATAHVTVTWPDGTTTTHARVATGRTVRITTPDLDRDGHVGFGDLLRVLAHWGPCAGAPAPCDGDLDLDGAVGPGDVLRVFEAWE